MINKYRLDAKCAIIGVVVGLKRKFSDSRLTFDQEAKSFVNVTLRVRLLGNAALHMK